MSVLLEDLQVIGVRPGFEILGRSESESECISFCDSPSPRMKKPVIDNADVWTRVFTGNHAGLAASIIWMPSILKPSLIIQN